MKESARSLPSIGRFLDTAHRVCRSAHYGQPLCPVFAFVVDCLYSLKVCRASVTKRGVTGRRERARGCGWVRCLSGSQHHLHSGGSLMWLALWRTDTLLLFTVPGALQGILGPEGKPVPGFMRGMSPPQIPWSPQTWVLELLKKKKKNSSCLVGKFSKRKVWEECEVTLSALSVRLNQKLFNVVGWVIGRNVNRTIPVSSQSCQFAAQAG